MNTTDPNQSGNSSTSPAEPVEMIRKLYARDVKDKMTVHTVFRTLRKQRQTARSGKPYLVLTLVDRTGELDARVFDQVDAADGAFQVDDFVLVRGEVTQFHGRPQLVIAAVERLDPEPIDAAEFAYTPSPAGQAHEGAPRGRAPLERLSDGPVKQLLSGLLSEHPELGGRMGKAEALSRRMELAEKLCALYPSADRDQLLGGVLLLSLARGVDAGASDEVRLVGGAVWLAQQLHTRATPSTRLPAQYLAHTLVAVDAPAPGAPRAPLTFEAMLARQVVAVEDAAHAWLGKPRWKTDGERPARPPRGEAKERSTEKRRGKPRGGASSEPPPEPTAAKPRDPGLPSDLSFKPFSELAKEPLAEGESRGE